MIRQIKNFSIKVFTGIGFLTILMVLFLISSDVFSQIPDQPHIVSVSIVDGHPQISWIPNTSITEGYLIERGYYETVNGIEFFNWEEIDDLPGMTQSFYIDYEIDACAEYPPYKVAAYSGGNFSQWNTDTYAMSTILITSLKFNPCSSEVTLEWTKDKNIPNLEYEILASSDGGNTFNSVGTTSASQFDHYLPPNATYSYKIRAFNTALGTTSVSCARSITWQDYEKPDFSNILVATVENNEHIKLVWEADNAPISKFQILRSETGSNYTFLAEIEDLSAYNPATSFIDTSADFYSTSYYYSIDVFDSCGGKHLESENIARTILLTGEKTSGSEITIQWNPYEGWANGIEKFEVYQEVDGVPFPATGPLADLLPTETTFTNDVSGLGGGEGNFTYYVKAYENGGNAEVSLSNKITIQLETSISIPNAIMPGGYPPDNEFKPLVDFIEQGFYSLTIYNKWGEQIFESKVVADGWDGTYKGEYVPGGTYVYLIKFRDARGQDQEKRGTVTVVR